MNLPTIKSIPLLADNVNVFGGLNCTNTCSDSEFRDMNNITTDEYPLLANRKGKKTLSYSGLNNRRFTVILGGENLIVCDGYRIIIIKETTNQVITCQLNAIEGQYPVPQIIRMGAYLCIFPYKKIVNLETSEVSDMERTYSGSVTFSITNATGEVITPHDETYYKTTKPQSNDYLIQNENGKDILKQYDGVTETWFEVYTTYIQMSGTGIGNEFKAGDGVKISLSASSAWEEGKTIFPSEENGVHYATYVLKNVSANSVTFAGILNSTHTEAITMKREVPDLAFVTEASNRLWGCNKKGTEIYACALGDPTNWNCFEGISTDSWAATVGSDGEFTGAITYLGYPIMFKENSLIKIGINSSGAHYTKETVCRGVDKGCNGSLVVVNEKLYYKSSSDICSYDGSMPVSISSKLGDVSTFENCNAGRNKSSYHISGYSGTDYITYVYDTTKGTWTKRSGWDYQYATVGDDLYSTDNNKIYAIDNTDYPCKNDTEDFDWYIQSRDMTYTDLYTSKKSRLALASSKQINTFSIKTEMDFGSEIVIKMKYDNEANYRKVATIKARGHKVTNIPLPVRMCEHYSFRIEGKGNCKIHQISKIYQEGGTL